MGKELVISGISDLLKTDCVYRLYDSDTKRLGCGTLFRRAGEELIEREVDTFDSSASCILTGHVDYSDHSGRRVRLGPGDVFQRVPRLVHTTRADNSEDFCEFFILLPGQYTSSLLDLGMLTPDPVWEVGLREEIIDELVAIREVLRDTRHLWHLEATARMQSLLIRYRQLAHASALPSQRSAIDEACLMLNNDPCGEISLQEIAQRLHIGYESFRKRFRDEVGVSPGAYRIRSRINRALSLLADRERSITDVANDLGYPDLFSFSKQFRQQTGRSPKAYRREINVM